MYALCGVFSFFDIIKKNLCEGEVWSPKFCMTKNAVTIWDPVHSLTSAASPFPALSLPSGALDSIRGKGWTPHKFLTSLPARGQSTTPLKLATASWHRKVAVKVEKNQFHSFEGREKSWETGIWVELETSVSIV